MKKINRNKKTEAFKGLTKCGRFAKTSLNGMRKAGIEGAKALKKLGKCSCERCVQNIIDGEFEQ